MSEIGAPWWSLEQARARMRAHSGMTEAQVLSETLRYPCDLPAQALAYKLGDLEAFAMQERRGAARGACFDPRDYHADLLANGALSMPDLRWYMEQVSRSSPATAGT